jgi:hypothetical protein
MLNWGQVDNDLIRSRNFQVSSIGGGNGVTKTGLKEKVVFLLKEHFEESGGILKFTS